MNFSFYIFGTPSGYNQYPADQNTAYFNDIALSNNTESQLTVKRDGQLVYYVYSRRLQENSRNFLGFCLVFNGVYHRAHKKLFELFESAYFDIQLKGELLKFHKGKSNFVVNKFVEKAHEVERIRAFLKNQLENDFTDISAAFKFGTGAKTIAIREREQDILSAIAAYEVVHLTNDEKALSELERAQQTLTKLWAENYSLQDQYNKSVAKRKQYGVVLVLSFVLIGCLIGLFLFNRNLQSKDSQIIYLEEELTEKDAKLEELNKNIEQLKNDKQQIRSEKRQFQIKISQLTAEQYRMANSIDQLNADLNAKEVRLMNMELAQTRLERENRSLQAENRKLQREAGVKGNSSPEKN